MNNFFTYIINLRDQMSGTLRRVGGSIVDTSNRVRRLQGDVGTLNKTPLSGLSASFMGLLKSVSPIVLITGAIYKLKQVISSSREASNIQIIAEKQLETVMRQRIGATDEQIDSIKKLASAQQALGVIGDEVQLSGAQQLTTFIKEKNSLEALLPAMNNLLAQQRGLKANTQDAVNIGNLMGKVMQGQTAALTRVGVTFTEAQEKILKYGSEQERAATLAQVITDNVGEMNKALAATPEGKLKQHANDMGDIQERIGKLVVSVQSALLPFYSYMGQLATRITSFFEQNEVSIRIFTAVIANVLIKVFSVLTQAFSWVYSGLSTFINGLRSGQPVFMAIAAIITTLTAALVAYKTVMRIITIATKAWAVAQGILNVIMSLNPIGLIIAGIVALIALIAFLIIKIDGWGETWGNVLTMCKLGFELFKTAVTLIWLKVQDAFLTGFEVIEKGWYKVQSLWNEDAANAGLSKLEAERNARAKEIADTQGKLGDLAKQMSDMEVFKLRVNDTSFSDVANGLKSKLGISEAGVPGMSGGGTGTGGTGGKGSASGKAANSIATGGSKTTHITLNLGNLVQTMTINSGDIKEGAQKVRDIVQDELTRALVMIQANI